EGGAVARLRDFLFFEKPAETAAIFSQIDGFRSGANDGNAIALQFESKIERRLAPELDDHATRLFFFDDGENVFESERLEVKTVRGVVVGRNRLRIAIDHDSFEAIGAKSEAGMAAAVIEFNALPDAVGAAAENHDLLFLGDVGFVFVLVAGIHVGSEGFEFGGAGIDTLENRTNPVASTLQTDGGGSGLPKLGEMFVASTDAFYVAEQVLGGGFDGDSGGAAIDLNDFFNLLNEPGIDLGQIANLASRQAAFESGENPINTVRTGRGQFLAQERVRCFRGRAPGSAGFKGANSLLQCFLEGTADGHDFADGFHLGAEGAVCAGKFFELPLGNLDHNVVDGGFEGSRSFLRNVVGYFVEGHADGKARGDFGDGKAGGFAG